jgi:hypothetical protein
VAEYKESDKDEIFSKRVRAGKRTYFFDVKATRSNDYYLTITESKRKYKEDGFTYEKHKIFLYKEDFDKFGDALIATIGHVKTELLPDLDFSQFNGTEDFVPEKAKAVEVVEETSTDGNSELNWD